jgi:hypothetical protein
LQIKRPGPSLVWLKTDTFAYKEFPMTDQALGTIALYADEKHSNPLERSYLQGSKVDFATEANDGIINLWLPAIFYKAVPLRPLKVGSAEESLELALFKKVGGEEHLVWSSGKKPIDNPKGLADFDFFWGLIELAVFPWGPGRYVVRAFADAETIAEGELEVALAEPDSDDPA